MFFMKSRNFAVALAFVAFASAGNVFAANGAHRGDAATRSTQMRLGYSDGNPAMALGLDMPVVVRCAVQFPQSELQRLKGSKITAIRFVMGCAPSTQEGYVFVSPSLDAVAQHKQTFTRLNGGWNEVKLDQPIEITGEELFVGYRYKSSGDALSMDGRDDNNYANWISITQSGDENESGWDHQGGGSLNLEVIVEGDNLPQNDAKLEKLMAKRYAGTNAKTPVNLVVKNKGAKTINSLELTYTVEDQETRTSTVGGLDIKSNAVAVVTLKDVVFEHNGVANLDVAVTKVNGEDDENSADNAAMVENVVSKKDYTNRKVLLEHFSTSNCNNCPVAHRNIDNALLYRNDVIHVVHHAGMGTDFLTIPAHEDYLYFFGEKVYTPAVMLDRTNMSPYGVGDGAGSSSTPGPAFFPVSATLGKVIDQSLSVPAVVTVDVNRQYDAAARKLKVVVTGDVPAGTPDRLKATDLRMNIFLVEDSIYGTQQGVADTEHYCHNNNVRAVLTGSWGAGVTFDGGKYTSDEYTFDVPADWKPEHVRIVAFLSNYNKADKNACQVFNADSKELLERDVTAIRQLRGNDADVKVVANGGQLFILGNHSGADIFSPAGRLLAHAKAGQTSLQTAALADGLLIVSVKCNGGVKTYKVMNRK